MIFKKCPGQDLNRKKREDVVCDLLCPSCGSKVEFFFDDKNRICPSCGNKVTKSEIHLLEDFGCARWCESAEKCLGPRAYKKLIDAKGEKDSSSFK